MKFSKEEGTMSVYSRTSYALGERGTGSERGAVSIDFTEALLMVGLVLGSKALGLW